VPELFPPKVGCYLVGRAYSALLSGRALIISSRFICRAGPGPATARRECSAATTCRSRPLVAAPRAGCGRFMALAAPRTLLALRLRRPQVVNT